MKGSEEEAKGSQEAHVHGANEAEALWKRLADQGKEMEELRQEMAAQKLLNQQLGELVTRLLARMDTGEVPVVGPSSTAPQEVNDPPSASGTTRPSYDDKFGELLTVLSRREAPLPGVFSLESGRSLELFLGRFESYCLSKFGEQTWESWTGELGRFLEGELLSVFRAFGGGDLPYTVMRQNLEKHCRATTASSQADELRRFLSAAPEPGEPLYVYAYRLARMYEVAYPGSSSNDLALQVRLMGSIPCGESMGVQQELDTIRSVSGIDLVPWDRIVSILRRRQDRQKVAVKIEGLSEKADEASPVIWYTSSTANQRGGQTYTLRSDMKTPSLTVPRAGTPDPARHQEPESAAKATKTLKCDWCGIPGHLYRSCWRRLGCCLRCGSNQHLIKQCPESRRARSRSPRYRNHLQGDRPGRAQSVPACPSEPHVEPRRRPSVGSQTVSGGPGMSARPGN